VNTVRQKYTLYFSLVIFEWEYLWNSVYVKISLVQHIRTQCGKHQHTVPT
jgi:hypothetical protein